MVSQKDIARAAGVDRSTVSLALRHHPSVARATGERIRRVAEELGYRPNPLLGELAARRWRQGARVRRETVAFLATRATDDHPILRAARARLDELGYGMEVVEPGAQASDRAVSRTLQHRGIRGVLLEQVTADDRERTLDWERFCAVRCGLLRRTAPGHRVSADLVEMVRGALARVVERGYRRVAFFYPVEPAYHSDELLVQAAAGARVLPAWREVIVEVAACGPGLNEQRTAAARLRARRPDVVITTSPGQQAVLREAGVLRGDVGYVALFGEEGDGAGEVAGYARHTPMLGRLAAELMDRLLRAHEQGLPSVPQVVSFMPEWRDGATLPLRKP